MAKGDVLKSIKGQEGYNNFGSKMIVSEDRGWDDIDIYFPEYNWTAEHKQRSKFKSGDIRCIYEPRYYGVGYLGDGKYTIYDENNKRTKQFMEWQNILIRCYDTKVHKKQPTYIDCSVYEELLNFQNFGKWFDDNYYEVPGEIMNLDKDILVKGNKIYSPDTMIFVPKTINNLFTKRQNERGEYPLGVHYDSRRDKLIVQCNNRGKRVYLGAFPVNQVNEAFQCYKEYKEKLIKEIADEYKDLIPQKLYDALYNYEVEITD